jgi:hypothetical protein
MHPQRLTKDKRKLSQDFLTILAKTGINKNIARCTREIHFKFDFYISSLVKINFMLCAVRLIVSLNQPTNAKDCW